MLQFLLHSMRAELVLELGGFHGYSAAWLAQESSAEPRETIVIEKNLKYCDVIRSWELPGVRVIHSDSVEL